jgi:hypothetical protein
MRKNPLTRFTLHLPAVKLHYANGWVLAFVLLLVFVIWENTLVFRRWAALTDALRNGRNGQAWNLLGRGLTDSNE